MKRKVCPVLRANSGSHFPLSPPSGKCIPFRAWIPGCGFRLRRHPETTSQSERGFRDGLSASHSFGNCIPFRMRIPGCGFHLMCHPDTTSQSERGFRDGLSAWAAIGKARPGLRCQGVFFTPAPCIEFDSPRVGGSVDGLRPGQDARSASHLYLAGALRGESAYLLRKSAPASAACRRPRPLATNASCLLNARALHRVRFSAVSVSNKKAGRDTSLPACNYWWSWRSFGRTPRHLDL